MTLESAAEAPWRTVPSAWSETRSQSPRRAHETGPPVHASSASPCSRPRRWRMRCRARMYQSPRRQRVCTRKRCSFCGKTARGMFQPRADR
eukprot:6195726-Pleurochrysis_carterae.AAC.3